MANSIITVLGDGVTTQYPLNFTLGILKREYVTCRVGDEVDGLGDPAYRTLEWVTDGLVNIQGAVPGDDVPIVFKRTIPKTVLLHNYSDGVPIVESNLDESNLQHIMSIHEFLDGRLEGGFVQELNMNNFKIINVAPGVDDADAANMSQINELIPAAEDAVELAEDWATKLGSTVDGSGYSSKEHAVGDLTATGGSAKAWAVDASSPNGTSDLSAKSYAALTAADRVQTGADRVAVAADKVITETARDQAVAASNGMKYRSVRAATTGNITLSGTQTIDTVAVIAGDRVLVRAQTAPAENGLYVVAAGAWTRASDADTWNELVSSLVVVEEGTSFVDYTFLCTSNQGGTLGVTAVTYILWQAFIAAGQVVGSMIATGAVTYDKIQNVSATDRLLGRSTAGAGDVEEITCTAFARSLLDDANATAARATLGAVGVTTGASVATTSGTSIDVTSIPANAKRIRLAFFGVSTNGTAFPRIQLGDSGGIENTGYVCTVGFIQSTNLSGAANVTAGFDVFVSSSGTVLNGLVELVKSDSASETWSVSGIVSNSGSNSLHFMSGYKTLSDVLDRIRLTTSNGTDTFDAGSITVSWEV